MVDSSKYKLLLLYGVPKSGTSSLFNDLIQFPTVIPNSVKELNEPMTNDQFNGRWFELFNPNNRDDGWMIDATQDYCWKLEDRALEYISTKEFKDMRVVLMFRNPVYRTLSNYSMNCKQRVKKGGSPIDFNTYIKSDIQMILNDYPAILNRAIKLFGADSVLPIISEDYYDNSTRSRILSEVATFIDAPDFDVSKVKQKIISPYNTKVNVYGLSDNEYNERFNTHLDMVSKFEELIDRPTGWRIK